MEIMLLTIASLVFLRLRAIRADRKKMLPPIKGKRYQIPGNLELLTIQGMESAAIKAGNSLTSADLRNKYTRKQIREPE